MMSWRKWSFSQVYSIIYGSVLFLLLLSGLLISGHILDVSILPFIPHLLAQVVAEAALLWFGLWLFQLLRWHTAKVCWLTLSFLALLLHIIDFYLVRFMDISMLAAMRDGALDSWQSFLETLQAATLDLESCCFIGVGTLVLLGMVLCGFHFLLKAWPGDASADVMLDRRIWKRRILYGGVLLGLAFFSDKVLIQDVPYAEYNRLAKALPWKITLLAPKPQDRFIIPHTTAAAFDPKAFGPIRHRPNLYLFIIESLRQDVISPSITPFLSHFAEEGYSSRSSFSSGNGTPISWFSILSGLHPYRWTDPALPQDGSMALKLLKTLGYDLRLFSSSRTSYYQLDQRLLGQHTSLMSKVALRTQNTGEEAWVRDQWVIEQLIEDRQNSPQEGVCRIIFLESSHFNYSWPQEQTCFEPVCTTLEMALIGLGRFDREGMRNRYWNSAHFVDHLLARFWDALPPQERDQAMVVITSDHGEEFFEHGHLFHASGLTEEQVRVPILYHFPQAMASRATPSKALYTSHVDIFPTLFDLLYGDDRVEHVLDGQSIFSAHHREEAITWRFAFSKAPREFVVHHPKQTFHGIVSWDSPSGTPHVVNLTQSTTVPQASDRKICTRECMHRLFSSQLWPKPSSSQPSQ